MPLQIAAIKDENSDGQLDRLQPTLDFVISQLSQTNGVRTITWNSVPGRTYQLEYSDQLGGQWFNLGGQTTAGPADLVLLVQDVSDSNRYYRVRLIQ